MDIFAHIASELSVTISCCINSQQSVKTCKCSPNTPDGYKCALQQLWKVLGAWHQSAVVTGTAWLDLAHVVNNANYANEQPNDDGEGFKSCRMASLWAYVCVCVCALMRGWEGRVGCLAPDGEHLCVCWADKWWSEHTRRHPQVSLHAYLALLRFHLNLCQWWRGSIHMQSFIRTHRALIA